ncbi:cobyrinate a,c-diamide synthase [Rubellimicrobium thermophilum]|uniref:cobyrinate a,c-diamide synthase n=1 Tax=Rubellimicrobium thermophilum TaxID=295419 RepID=UPI00058F01CC|nr:cobyrinate a,c-diamide synthase [Rubellimicrobium thermophilum]
MRGLLVAAPASGSGKTVVTLGLLRALRQRGLAVRGAKSGPDYIDPRFHEAACGAPCLNLDAWAMAPARLQALAAGDGLLLVEGAMGLFDGAPPEGRGSAGDLARILGIPVVLVVDASRLAQSAGPLIAGFLRHDPAVRVVAVLLNRVGSPRHGAILRAAVEREGTTVLGLLPRAAGLVHPSRHLGLVQAAERADLESFIQGAADWIAAHADLDALAALAAPLAPAPATPRLPPPAQRIALAADAAFAFAYPHLLVDWRAAGAEILPFSPLADQAVPEADLVILPGGYPELHAGRIAAAETFMSSLRKAAKDIVIYGECGGYMVLGDSLEDETGRMHRMAGLLPLSTSFARRRLHLGYRIVETGAPPFAGRWAAHEFHYATVQREEGRPLFRAWDAEGRPVGPMGLRQGRVCGSFAHLIDRLDGQAPAGTVALAS